jgi:hypothetical protein
MNGGCVGNFGAAAAVGDLHRCETNEAAQDYYLTLLVRQRPSAVMTASDYPVPLRRFRRIEHAVGRCEAIRPHVIDRDIPRRDEAARRRMARDGHRISSLLS